MDHHDLPAPRDHGAALQLGGDRGAVLPFLAIMLISLLAVSALALDIGLIMNQRRQDQSSADNGAITGGWQKFISGSSDTITFVQVTANTYNNLDLQLFADPPTLAEWRGMWTAANCQDDDNAGYTQLTHSTLGAIDCMSYKDGSSGGSRRFRVKLPDTEVFSIFRNVFTDEALTTSAVAEVEVFVGQANIIPFAMSPTPGTTSGLMCLKSPPNGQIGPDTNCSGSTSGDFGYVALTRPATPGLQQQCNGGHNETIEENIAAGLDHVLSTYDWSGSGTPNSNNSAASDPLAENSSWCDDGGAGEPNRLQNQTGNIAGTLDLGFVSGLIPDFNDGQPARLKRGPYPKTLNIHGQLVDNSPLWQFLDTQGNAGTSLSNDVPRTCDPTMRTSATEMADPVNGTGGLFSAALVAADAKYGTAAIDSWEEMYDCLIDYDQGDYYGWTAAGVESVANSAACGTCTPYSTLMFGKDSNSDGVYDIELSPRFTWIPESWQNLGGVGNNDFWHIKRFRAVYVQTVVFTKGSNNNILFNAGEPGPTDSVNPNQFSGLIALSITHDALPDEIIDDGPTRNTKGVKLVK